MALSVLYRQRRQNELLDFRMRDLYEKLALPDDVFDDYLRSMKLLPSVVYCDSCLTPMSLNKVEKQFICHRRSCRTGPTLNTKPKKSQRTGSFFEKSKLDNKTIFELAYHWVRKTGTVIDRAADIDCHPNSVLQWDQYFRDICCEQCPLYRQVVGGFGHTVEIDETLVARRKYHRGRRVRQLWMFGGIERGSRKIFLEIVEKRNERRLIPLILLHIRPGTVIMSDCWRAYNNIRNLPAVYTHMTVNHSVNFVDPITGCHTQNIESLWQKFKCMQKRNYGLNGKRWRDYLSEFIWRREKGPRNALFYNLWEDISQLYPLL